MLFKEIITAYGENHTKPIKYKAKVISCQIKWDIHMPLNEGLMNFDQIKYWGQCQMSLGEFNFNFNGPNVAPTLHEAHLEFV
jgi:hypothetical protein